MLYPKQPSEHVATGSLLNSQGKSKTVMNIKRPNVYFLSNSPQESGDSYEYTFGEQDFEKLDDEVYPSKQLMQYGESAKAHRASGRRDVEFMSNLLEKHAWSGGDVLDYGCSNGRMTRWLRTFLPNTDEIFGLDIDCRRVFWALRYLSNTATYLPCNTSYHLPFMDDKFSLVMFYSIFTHMDETAFAWLHELRRVTKVGGIALVTLHDHDAVKRLLEILPDESSLKKGVLNKVKEFTATKNDLSFFRNDSGTVLQTFISKEIFTKCCAPGFEVVEVAPNTMGGFQSLYVLRRVK